MIKRTTLIAGILSLAGASSALADDPIKVLIITGKNNHNWQFTSRVHKDTLEATGKFKVDITDVPEATLADAKTVMGYKVFVIDYNDMGAEKRWGAQAEENFVGAVGSGVGVVAIHSANNAFKGWTEYEKILALLWRDGTGHGKFHPFDVVALQGHPINKGITVLKNHPDELYHKMVNTQKVPFDVIYQAYSDPATGGTGQYEQSAITLNYGKGRVFATSLGHVWVGSDESKYSVCDPQFKIMIARAAEWTATGAVTLPFTWQDVSTHNTLSEKESADGWKLLFDGKTSNGWRLYKGDKFPDKGWIVKDGSLWRQPGEAVGDLVTADEYTNFEFACDWKVSEGGNSGIIYHTTEDHGASWETGPEYQVLDDLRHPDHAKGKTRAATLYDLVPCAFDVSRPAGEWNHARIVVKGTHVEHWLNDFKVVDIDTASDAYKKAFNESKWVKMPDYGKRAKGHIALQDHGDEVQYRNIKLRKLD